MPSLCSMPVHITSLREPSSKNFGTTNNEIPFTPSGAPSIRASTRWMMLSVKSCSPYVIKIFCPKMRNTSPSRTAFVRTAARSDPACGSVKFIVPVHVPETIFSRYVVLIPSPAWASIASTAPWLSSGHRPNDKFAPCHISWSANATSHGKPCPPCAGSNTTEFHPPSQNCLYASLNPFAVVTTPSLSTFPSRSPLWLMGASTPPASCAAGSRMLPTVSASRIPKSGCSGSFSKPTTRVRVNIWSAIGGK